MDNRRDILIEKFGEPVSESSNEMKFACPMCGHKALTVNMEIGLYYCFICSFGSSKAPIFENTTFVKRAVNHTTQKAIMQWLYENLKLSASHREYLRRRGIYHPEKYGLATIPPRVEFQLKKHFTEVELLESGFYRVDKSLGINGWPCLKHNRIFIPILEDNKVVCCKTRLDPREDMFNDIKYALPTGSTSNRHVAHYQSNSPYRILTEGEFKAMACNELGIDAIASPGINGAAALMSYAKRLDHKKRSFIIFDSEREDSKILGRIQSAKIAQVIPNSAIVLLPKDNTDEKMDLDLYLTRYSLEDFEDLLEDFWLNRDRVLEQELKLL
jgi:ribosomal protein L37AE/L43A